MNKNKLKFNFDGFEKIKHKTNLLRKAYYKFEGKFFFNILLSIKKIIIK